MAQETDRELLEMAARAAGYALKWGDVYIVGDDEVDCTYLSYVVSGQPDEADWHWDPLTDDGDALRLAVKLEMDFVRYSSHAVSATGRSPTHGSPATYVTQRQELDGDPYAATRRVIVRAAAAIGRAMP